MNFSKYYSILVTTIVLIIGIIVILWVQKTNEEKNDVLESGADRLSVSAGTVSKRTELGYEIDLYIEIKNNNLKPFHKVYNSPCEEILSVDWLKDGEPLQEKIKDCEQVEKKEVTFEPAEANTYIYQETFTEPGTYEAVIEVFGEKISEEIKVGKTEE